MLADEVDPLELAAEDEARPAHLALPAPKVLVLYRDRGVPWLLVPPILILAAVVGIVASRNTIPRRPGRVEPQDSRAAEPGRTDLATRTLPADPPPAVASTPPPSMLGGGGAPPPAEPIAVAPPATAPPIPADRAVANAGPVLPAPIPPTPPVPGPAGSDRDAPTVGNATPSPGSQGPSPFEVPPGPSEPTRRDPVGFDRETVSPPAGPEAPSSPNTEPGKPAATLPPIPTAAETEAELQKEADRVMLERRRLEAAKPNLLNPDSNENKARLADMVLQARRSVEDTRRPFHRDLRRLLSDFGKDAGPEIQRLSDRYGKEMLQELMRGMNRDLVGVASRLTTRARVQRMRQFGAPESLILEDLFLQEQLNRSSRGGPKSDDEAWVFAARILLSIPPGDRPPRPQPATAR